MLGVAWGLGVGLLGAGMLALLAAFCVMRLGSRAVSVYAPIIFPLTCAASFVVLQVMLHGESLMGSTIRPFVTWILALIVVQSLSLRRGFLHRFAYAALAVGIMLLPYVQYRANSGRLGLEAGLGMYNPNQLAAWFGFCAVYFIIVGIEAKHNGARAIPWLIAVGCLYVVGLAVSRGNLFGVALATTVALRRLLKRGFIPVLAVLILSWTIYELGLFEQIAASYAARGAVETGRGLVWPLAIRRFLDVPLTGVGASSVQTFVPGRERSYPPHNGFIYLALASGVIPLAFFVAYWVRAVRGAHTNVAQPADAPFRIPLLIFAFVVMSFTDLAFVESWQIVVLSTAMAGSTSRRLRQVRRYRTAKYLGRPGRARYAMARYQLGGHSMRF